MSPQPSPPSPAPTPDQARGPRLSSVLALVLTVLVGSALLVGAVALQGPWRPAVAGGSVERGSEPTFAHGEPGTSDVRLSTDGYAVWDHNTDGLPVRWDACSPVELVVNPDGAPPGAHADLERAVEVLGEATGLRLRIVGEVDERPNRRRAAYQPARYGQRWAPVLVAWASPHENDLPLRDTDRGLAIPIAVGPDGDRTYVTGQVVLNAERRDLLDGWADRSTSWGATFVHELAHVLGLAHVDDPDQMMHVYPGEGPIRLGEGDLAGLAAIGADRGCADVPPARAVQIAAPERV